MEVIVQVIVGLVVLVLGGGAVLTLLNKNKKEDKEDHERKVKLSEMERQAIKDGAKDEREKARETAKGTTGKALLKAFTDRVRRQRGRRR